MRLGAYSLCLTCLITTLALAEQKPPVPRVEADEIARIFDFNEATVEEYLDHKTVDVSGKAERVFSIYAEKGNEKVKRFVVELKATGTPVQCVFEGKYRKELAKINPHGAITIRGTCLGRTAYKRPGQQPPPASNAGPAQANRPQTPSPSSGRPGAASEFQAAAIVFTDCVLLPVEEKTGKTEAKEQLAPPKKKP